MTLVTLHRNEKEKIGSFREKIEKEARKGGLLRANEKK